MRIRIFVLCYDEETQKLAVERFGGFDWATILVIPSSLYLENCMYSELLEKEAAEWEGVDYVGTISYKAPEKIKIPDVKALAKRLEVSGHDVVAFYHTKPGTQLLKQADCCHEHFSELWTQWLTTIGYKTRDAEDHNIRGFYGNYWIAKVPWMKRYMAFYKQAQEVLDTADGEFREKLWSDSRYPVKIKKERCVSIFGKDYYPYHPFLCERLASFYFHRAGARILFW